MQDMRRELITWEDVDKLIDHLIPQFEVDFEAMVLITRGGIVPGGLLAEAMGVPRILTAAVDFPTQIEKDKSRLYAWPSFLQFPDNDLIAGRRTLVVDDVWGSGRTITTVKNRISAEDLPGMVWSLHAGGELAGELPVWNRAIPAKLFGCVHARVGLAKELIFGIFGVTVLGAEFGHDVGL